MYIITYILRIEIFKECLKLCKLSYTKNVHNFVYSTYTTFQRMYIIMSIQCTCFSKNVHNFFKNVLNYVHSMNKNFHHRAQWSLHKYKCL